MKKLILLSILFIVGCDNNPNGSDNGTVSGGLDYIYINEFKTYNYNSYLCF